MIRRKRREMRRWAESNKNNKHSLQKNTVLQIPFRHPINTIPNNNNCNDNKYTNKRLRTNIPPAKYHRQIIPQCETTNDNIQNRKKNIKTPVIGMPPLPFPMPLPQPPKQCKPQRPIILSQKQHIENKKNAQKDCSSCNCFGDQVRLINRIPRIQNLKYRELLRSQSRITGKSKSNVANYTLPGSLYGPTKPTWKKFLNKRDYCNVDFDCPCEDMRTSYIDFTDYDLHIQAKNITVFDPSGRYIPPFNTPVEKFSCIRVPLPYIINKIPDTQYNITPFDLHNLPTIKVLNEDFLFQQFFTPEDSSSNQVFLSSNARIHQKQNRNYMASRIIQRNPRKAPSFDTEPIHPRTKDIYYKNILNYVYQLGEPLFLHENNFFIPYTYSYQETIFNAPWNSNTTKTKYITTNIIDYVPKIDLFGKTFPILFESDEPPNLYEEPLEMKLVNHNSFPDSSFNIPTVVTNGLPQPTELIPLFDLSINYTGPSTYIYQFGEPTYELEKEKIDLISIIDTKIEIFADNININNPPVIQPPKMTSYHELNKNFNFIHNNIEYPVAIHQLSEPPRFKTFNYIKYNNVEEIFDINILKPKPSETISDISNVFDLSASNPRKITKDSFFEPKNKTMAINFNYIDYQIYQIPDQYLLKDNERTNLNAFSFPIYMMKKYEPFDGNYNLSTHKPFDFPEFTKINFYYSPENEYTILTGVVPGPIANGLDININDEICGILDFSFKIVDETFAPSISKFIDTSGSITAGISTIPNDIVSLIDASTNLFNTMQIVTVNEKLPFIKQLGGEFVKQKDLLEIFKGDEFSFKDNEYPMLISPDELVTSFREEKEFISQFGIPPRLIPRANISYELFYYKKDIPPFDFEKIKDLSSTSIPIWSRMFEKLQNKQTFMLYKRNSIFQIGSPIAYDNSGNTLPVEKNIRCISRIDKLFMIPNMPILSIKKYDIDINEEYTIIRNVVPAPTSSEFIVNINDTLELYNIDYTFTYVTEVPSFDFNKLKDISGDELPLWNNIQVKSIQTNTHKYFITPIAQLGEPIIYNSSDDYRIPYIKLRIGFSTLIKRLNLSELIPTPDEFAMPIFNIGSVVLNPDEEYFIMSSITPGI